MSKKTPQFLQFLFVLLAFILIPAACNADDWPQWRGPHRDGLSREKGLMQDWPSEGPPLLWKTKGLGAGYSTLSISNKKIYTMGDKGESTFLIALRETDGALLWSLKIGASGAPGWGGYAGPRAAPTVDGDLVFAVGQWGDLVCADTATGKKRWGKNYAESFASPRPEWGFAESPLVDGNNLIITPGGKEGVLVALNKETGQLVWGCGQLKDSVQYASPIVVEIDHVRQYIQVTLESLVGVAAMDGKLLWRAPRKGATAVIDTPIYNDHLVYVSSHYGTGCNLFKITSTNGVFGAEQLYANKVMANHHGGVVLVDGFLYGYSEGKGWTCQNLKTGIPLWQEKEKLPGGSLLYADNRLYLRSESGKRTVALIEPTSDGYKEHGRFDPPDRADQDARTHPVIANGRLYLRDQDELLAFDLTPHSSKR